MRVYYLTSEVHAISNIEKKRVKVSLFDDLNDPFELMGFNVANQGQRKVWDTFREYFTTKMGLVCFSNQWQNPVMWSHYGDKHRGICLGFDVSDQILKKVKYITRRKQFHIGQSLDAHRIEPDLISAAIRYKFKEWSYEREYRGIVPLDEKDKSGHYFVSLNDDFVLREVIIGARCNRTPNGFKDMLLPYANSVKVTKSRLAFQSFKVVRNKAVAEYKNV